MPLRRPAALLLVAAALAGCFRREPPPDLGPLPAFALTDQDGNPVGTAQLGGRVWVANLIFTRCPDVCPVLSQRMAALQSRLPANVDLISITVDPAHDTPEVLRAYATAHGATPRWRFLTGPRDVIVGLMRNGFKVAFRDDGPPEAPIAHSERFMLVDGDLRLRGAYLAGDDDATAALVADATLLAAATPR